MLPIQVPSTDSSREIDTANQCFQNGLQFYEALRNCKDNYISKQINQALNVLGDAFRLYGPDRVFSSYNGGKDADVIMHLLRAVCAKYQLDHNIPCAPKLIYFAIDDEFPEVLSHIEKNEERYSLNIVRYDSGIVEGIKQHFELIGAYPHSAFAIGTRKGDPNCENQEFFSPSSTWMPIPFMRVNPIINWEYGHVWHFLRLFKLPYCPLYDAGYTSLGKRKDTFPNPALLRKTMNFLEIPKSPGPLHAGDSAKSSSTAAYWPAYMLSDWSLERSGRMRTPSLASTVVSKQQQQQKKQGQNNNCPSPFPEDNDANNTTVPIHDEHKYKIESAALIIIGDEILNGLTLDLNLQVTSKALQTIDIPLKMVSIISDEINEIAAEVIRMSQKYDIVITSGGIGPTHDDVTIKGIAKALKQEMKINIEMLQHLEDIQQEEVANNSPESSSISPQTILKKIIVNDSDLDEYWKSFEKDIHNETGEHSPLTEEEIQHRLFQQRIKKNTFMIDETMESFAFLPNESILHFPPPPDDYYDVSSNSLLMMKKRKTWPILQCDNIYILPGIPQYFAQKIHLLTKYFLKSKRINNNNSNKDLDPSDQIPVIGPKEIRKIVLNIEEKNLVQILNTLVEKYQSSSSSSSIPPPSSTSSSNQGAEDALTPPPIASPSMTRATRKAIPLVKFGSYPFVDHPEYKTIITLESHNVNHLDDAMSDLIQLLPSKSVLRVEKIDFSEESS